MIEIYTDGACLGNPGPGGWGAILIYKEHQKKISGAERETTNNRMEMRAVIEALKVLKRSSKITLHTDSKYVMEGITNWIESWKKNNWRNANRKPVKNSDLWLELDVEVKKHQIKWIWVKGHSGNHYNEIVDKLAREAADQ
ncbi:MAG: ribonuclease HI [Alphaproteobacteria bacterium RIFCSPLOWO2_01_FULL_40_26]|nr:MAG: ribonuclease HI [Alphaproteobacteria bacterium RIFCSPHIGHO2_02_FULL_40_34]OFW88185.1 MAG: ribonuclease HI [Alphaproteobacteria bacterium RIFCSPHIGHO2_01_FULL_40_8]OFW95311.1 MAG: ribonuclease HI [Alphaproteobacteria bacterium RIFCSPLOWO2_01_FULL_40_26]OFX09214.1 MAG: ribonuclease HI [Alphaproteobacteria bacterium RIFCSPLOWO2_02_FULL_40_19]OFX11569.1 MAG: ribonuclease HI [Alphaproteobacteria bacterium RIFCSPLOWO2_12_FULL_40_11]